MKSKESIKVGTKRVVKRFAFFPMDLNGIIYWFKTIYIIQIRIAGYGGFLGEFGHPDMWVNDEITTKDQYLKMINL